VPDAFVCRDNGGISIFGERAKTEVRKLKGLLEEHMKRVYALEVRKKNNTMKLWRHQRQSAVDPLGGGRRKRRKTSQPKEYRGQNSRRKAVVQKKEMTVRAHSNKRLRPKAYEGVAKRGRRMVNEEKFKTGKRV